MTREFCTAQLILELPDIFNETAHFNPWVQWGKEMGKGDKGVAVENTFSTSDSLFSTSITFLWGLLSSVSDKYSWSMTRRTYSHFGHFGLQISGLATNPVT